MTGSDAKKYRDLLDEQALKSQAEYDRLVVALSGGAFGISFAFIDRLAGDAPVMTCTITVAWVLWALSLTCALWSHRTSAIALRNATKELDRTGSVDPNTAGGMADKATNVLNFLSGGLFIFGLLCVCLFAAANFGR